jgi:phenylalanyl-tRNA synthetase alpha subunit
MPTDLAPPPGDDLDALRRDASAELAAAADLRAWDAARVGLLGKSGRLTALLKGLGAAPPEERKARGAALNRLKVELEARSRRGAASWRPRRWTRASSPSAWTRRCRPGRTRPRALRRAASTRSAAPWRS